MQLIQAGGREEIKNENRESQSEQGGAGQGKQNGVAGLRWRGQDLNPKERHFKLLLPPP